ncbi:MAG: Hg(II)-responsive transcriptional regulator [Nitrospirales bacterium]|nr:MAG: Hg(II)-responsive transcriptional regulator [Nitrospirales bacterium]
MRIGQVAKRAGVNVETIRFYERKGLITQPPTNTGGYRQYPKEAIARIRFIKRAKELGFSLTEVLELLTLQTNPQATCADVKSRAEDKISTIHGRIKDLQKMRRSLERLAAACKGSGPLDECPIIDCFETNKKKEE